ncbi:hypothetical protein E3T25_04875 [Cryobacterium sandaracinum]|uniref:Uncharacterized protein n=1 Tax=Cryobacterium sandaracinum TaxID=1259247 RepID=A0ABY2JJT4_9MICO|nr:hypothetical protein [Cryobacterium sandaracinum]TFD04848.1 hypothetical protein E3T25_04875 [Cryobacterium sandaracinum]
MVTSSGQSHEAAEPSDPAPEAAGLEKAKSGPHSSLMDRHDPATWASPVGPFYDDGGVMHLLDLSREELDQLS